MAIKSPFVCFKASNTAFAFPFDFCSITFIFDGIYKGLGWMKDLRNVLLFSTFIIFVPFVILFDHYELGLHGIFYAFTLWIFSRSIPLIIKFRKTFNNLS